MSLLDAYQEGTDTTIQFQIDRPLEPPKPKPKHSGWTTLPRAVAAGVAEVGANVSDVLGASAQTYADFGMNRSPFEEVTDEQRAERDRAIENYQPNFRPEQSRALYDFSKSMRVDPETATFAENLFFNLGKGLTKAIGGAVVAGPIGGASVLGVSEGMTTAEELADQGVDLSTRTGVGATVGLISGATALLPVAGQTMKQTAALAFVGGPGAFVAQQKIASDILSRANYVDIAKQYDPLDPVGLTVSALVPFGLGLYSMKAVSRATARQNAKSDTSTSPEAEVQPAAQDAQPAPTKTESFEPQENVDVAMVQNLTVQRDIADSTPVAKYAAELSKQEVTDNPNFKNWFGDSKVVDAEGKPLVVYHGTNSTFDAFDPKRAGAGNDRGMRGRGFYFSPNEKTSKGYGPVSMPVYLSIHKPFRPSDFSSSEEISNALGIDDSMFKFEPESGEFRVYQSFSGAVTSAIKDAGYDGVIYGKGQEVIAFYPEQIKSAIGNSGLFNPNSSSLTDQIIRTTEQARASQVRTAEASPLKPADNEPTVMRQTIERYVADNPNMEVSIREDGTRVKLADEVQAIRREIANGTDDELGTNDARLVQAAIQCFLGD